MYCNIQSLTKLYRAILSQDCWTGHLCIIRTLMEVHNSSHVDVGVFKKSVRLLNICILRVGKHISLSSRRYTNLLSDLSKQ